MVIYGRLETVGQLIEEYGLVLTIKLVPSEKNISDALIRVPKNWLHSQVVPGKERKAKLLHWVQRDRGKVLQRFTAGITWELRE